MKTNMKRLLSVLLALTMACGLLPGMLSTAHADVYCPNCGSTYCGWDMGAGVYHCFNCNENFDDPSNTPSGNADGYCPNCGSTNIHYDGSVGLFSCYDCNECFDFPSDTPSGGGQSGLACPDGHTNLVDYGGGEYYCPECDLFYWEDQLTQVGGGNGNVTVDALDALLASIDQLIQQLPAGSPAQDALGAAANNLVYTFRVQANGTITDDVVRAYNEALSVYQQYGGGGGSVTVDAVYALLVNIDQLMQQLDDGSDAYDALVGAETYLSIAFQNANGNITDDVVRAYNEALSVYQLCSSGGIQITPDDVRNLITALQNLSNAYRDYDYEISMALENAADELEGIFGGEQFQATTRVAVKYQDALALYEQYKHTHGNWSYSVSSNAITAECGGTGPCDYPNGITLTISAPANLVYEGSPKTATLNTSAYPDTAPEGLDAKPTSISYNTADGQAPTEPGAYTASFTWGDRTASVSFTILMSVSGVTLNPSDAQAVTVGESVTFTATVAPDNATNKTVVWASSDTSVATVENGVVTAVAAGTATITATATNGTADTADDKTASCVVTVNPITYTVTYTVVNGTWEDDTTENKTETVADGSKPASVPTGMKAAQGYTGGEWDVDPADATITGETTFTYTFEEIPTYTVTYTVVNGTWEDDTTENKTETVESGAKPANVPTGMKANQGYTGGTWDVDPANATITEAAAFTYAFEAIPTYTVTYTVVNGTWEDDTTEDKTETVESGAKPANVPTGMKAAEGYTGGEWDVNPADATITEETTFTYTYAQKEEAVVADPPTAMYLTYDGTAQELVFAGQADGGTMNYALGTDDATEPTDGWSEDVPTGTDVGTYYVWYKAVGDEEHVDSAAGCVTVTIEENTVEIIGNKCYINDELARGAGIVCYEDDFYFVKNTGAIVRGTSLYVKADKTNGLISAGTYEFEADGRMVGKNGIVGSYYYENSMIQKGVGLVAFDGGYYYVQNNGKILKDATLYVSAAKTNGLASPGSYQFNADGKMEVKNGIINGRFYEDNIVAKGTGLIKIDGDYYYVKNSGALAKNTTLYVSAAKSNGLVSAGRYSFGDDGKLVIWE